jgi:muramidase (phage lysozyme)
MRQILLNDSASHPMILSTIHQRKNKGCSVALSEK